MNTGHSIQKFNRKMQFKLILDLGLHWNLIQLLNLRQKVSDFQISMETKMLST